MKSHFIIDIRNEKNKTDEGFTFCIMLNGEIISKITQPKLTDANWDKCLDEAHENPNVNNLIDYIQSITGGDKIF
jgi:hypothetical protein